MIKRNICMVLSGIAGALLGLSLFLAISVADSGQEKLADAEFARDGVEARCEDFVSAGLVSNCRIVRLVAINPETDKVYGAYVYDVLLEGGKLDGSRIFLVVLTEGQSVVEIK